MKKAVYPKTQKMCLTILFKNTLIMVASRMQQTWSPDLGLVLCLEQHRVLKTYRTRWKTLTSYLAPVGPSRSSSVKKTRLW